MAILPNKLQKIFGGSQTASGNIAQMGSTITGTPVYSTDLDVIQALSAYANGFPAQVMNGTNSPDMQEIAAFFRMVTQQIAYQQEAGVSEWLATRTYGLESMANDGAGKLYRSIISPNVGNALSNTTYWVPYDSNPVATVIEYAGAGAPLGYLVCDGSAVNRSGAYAALFAIVGTTYGAGNGTTTFNLPDLRGRAAVGLGSVDGTGGTNWTLGLKDGAEGVTLVPNQLPTVAGPEGSNADNGDPGALVVTAATQGNGGHPAQFGGDQPHANVPPSLGLNKCIKF